MTNVEMVRILKVSPKGKKYLVLTSIDDNGILLTEDAIVNNRIIKDRLFTVADWQLIQAGINDELLFDKTLHYIDYKPRTTLEIVVYLKDKGATDDTISVITKRLQRIGYLDDERYAKMYLEESIKNGHGRELIKYQLIKRGIEEAIIEKYLPLYRDEVEENKCLEVANKYLKNLKGYPFRKQKELIYQKLLREGFSGSCINKINHQLTYHETDLAKLQSEYDKLQTIKGDQNKVIQSLLQKGYQYEEIKMVIKLTANE